MKRSVNIGAALIIYPRVFLAGMYTFWFESAINMYIQINGIRVSYFSLYEIAGAPFYKYNSNQNDCKVSNHGSQNNKNGRLINPEIKHFYT